MKNDGKKTNRWGLTQEEVAWLLTMDPPRRKPKPVPVVSVPVSEKIADAVKTNPGSVRVTARDADGVSRFEGPLRNPQHVTVRVDLVQEVDANGRPVYHDRGGVVSEYNPIDRLRI
jgi:hypothetical protein